MYYLFIYLFIYLFGNIVVLLCSYLCVDVSFSELGISVKPRKGRAVVWNNMDKNGNCESMSAHVADIVTNGHKYILQRW